MGQKPVRAAKTLGTFRSPESLNSARIERMTLSVYSLLSEQSIARAVRLIRALFNDSGDRNLPIVSVASMPAGPLCGGGLLDTADPALFRCRLLFASHTGAARDFTRIFKSRRESGSNLLLCSASV